METLPLGRVLISFESDTLIQYTLILRSVFNESCNFPGNSHHTIFSHVLLPLPWKHKFPWCQDIHRMVKIHNSLPFWNAEFVGNTKKCFSVQHFQIQGGYSFINLEFGRGVPKCRAQRYMEKWRGQQCREVSNATLVAPGNREIIFISCLTLQK